MVNEKDTNFKRQSASIGQAGKKKGISKEQKGRRTPQLWGRGGRSAGSRRAEAISSYGM